MNKDSASTFSQPKRKRLFFYDHPLAKSLFWFFLFILPFLAFLLTIIYPFIYHQTFPITDQKSAEPTEFVSEFKPVAGEDKKELKAISDKLVALKFSELYYQAQLQMAKSDSIGLSINLLDSTVSLMLKGVNIRSNKIARFKTSRLLKNIKHDLSVFDWLAGPFNLQHEWATLAKFPIKIRKAPRDTIEAKLMKVTPFELEKPTVFFTLQFNRNLIVRVHQLESPSFSGWMKKWYYNGTLNYLLLKSTFKSLLHCQTPLSPIWLDLWVSQNDGRAIFRALPTQANLVLRL